jgi:DNA primase
MGIPASTLEQIGQRLDLVEVIGGFVSLKRSGRNFKGLCPFHPEKSPSFMVYPAKQFFICYGCGAGGDLIAFVMRHEHMEFKEAVHFLAEKAGVQVSFTTGGSSLANRPLYQAHETAAAFYHEKLVEAPEGEPARAYLAHRGLTPETWKTLRLGFAPNRWEGLLTHSKGKGLEPSLLERSGLAVRREGAEEAWYDRFRNRVLFPIWDQRGRVIAFGGRVLGEEAGPKYLNSPETELYVKGRLLYGFHLASSAIREKDFCLVVEGYMDFASLYQAGIRNVVASMGTSLTPEQVQLIRRLTRHVVILYDGDYAGEMAALRGLDLFLEAEMRVKVVGLPSGLDPDAFLAQAGLEEMLRTIRQSQDLFDYKLGLLTRRFDPKDLQGRIRISEEMLPTIKRVTNAIERGEYVKRLGEVLRVAEPLLWSELGRVRREAAAAPRGAGRPEKVQPVAGMTPEESLAGLLLEEPGRVRQVEERLPLEAVQDAQVREILSRLWQMNRSGTIPPDGRTFLAGLPREDSGAWEGRIVRWLAWADLVVDKEGTLEELLAKVKEGRVRSSLEALHLSIRQAEAQGQEQETAQLIAQYNTLMKSRSTKKE